MVTKDSFDPVIFHTLIRSRFGERCVTSQKTAAEKLLGALRDILKTAAEKTTFYKEQ